MMISMLCTLLAAGATGPAQQYAAPQQPNFQVDEDEGEEFTDDEEGYSEEDFTEEEEEESK